MSGKFIVTGAAGFIGCNIVRALNARGHRDILTVDRLDSDLKKSNLEGLQYSEYIDKDEFRRRFLGGSQQKVTTVFHLGACSSTTETNADYLTDNNFLYTRQLCQWCLRNGARFIYASSAATYGDGSLGYSDDHAGIPSLRPLNLYGRSKQLFDLWALQNNAIDRIAGIKYFNVYGPYEDHKGDMRSVVNKAYDQIKQTGEITLFKSYRPEFKDGEQERDFVFVKDAVDVTLFFSDHPEVSGIFNCGTGTARTWIDLANAVFKAMDRKPVIRFIEMPEHLRDKYQYHTMAGMTKLRSAGYKIAFTSLEDGVGEYVRKHLAAKPRPKT